jgi:NADH-quinone oxidoreductase subunit E
VCEVLDKHERDPHKLVAILQEIQEIYSFLPEEIMAYTATALGISPAQVFGVATFYSHFTLTPKGKYVIKVCDGTACHVRKSTAIIDAIKAELNLVGKQNTCENTLFTLEEVACLGACGLAPVVVVNDTVYGAMTPEKTLDVIREIKANNAAEEG